MKKSLFIWLTVFLISLAAAQNNPNKITVSSPNHVQQLIFHLADGKPYYELQRFGREIIGRSRLGFVLKSHPDLAEGFKLLDHKIVDIDTVWEQPWGEKRHIRDHCRELTVRLVKEAPKKLRLDLIFRVYDDGVGFRYRVPAQPNLQDFEIMDELTEFNLAGNHESWWIPAYQWNRYEYLYNHTPLSQIDTVHTPFTMKTDDGLYLSIHEAALTDFASMTLARKGEHFLEADLVPWSDGVKVKTQAPMVSPWRTVQVADTPGALITSYLILNLNEPSRIQDVSWIKPGKYVGIWWEMHINKSTWGSGEKHGATTENAKKYIDFAAKYGFDGVLVEGWNVGWEGDWIKNAEQFSFTKAYPDFDIEEVCRYAAEKGVRLIGHHETAGGILNYEKQMKDAFALYEKLGVRAVKTGYVAHGREIKRIDENGKIQYETHHGQFMVRHYRKVVEEAARHHIMLDVHEPVKPTGIRRTWPNMMTREGARGQEFNAWAGDGGNPPDYTTILPFTRLLAGPMDFTPGIFDIMLNPWRPDNRVNTTLAKQLALYVVIYSPLHMAADLPENYEKHLDAFQFIVDVPTDWEDTRVLNAEIGDYLTVVRKDRNSQDWYLGSITDENGRWLTVNLGFLQPGVKYRAQIYRDADNADWQSNPVAYTIEEKEVTCGDDLELRLAPGGGVAIRFTPVK